MKLLIEYGAGKNLITISGVEEITELPFGFLCAFSSESNIEIDKQKIHSMEILPDA